MPGAQESPLKTFIATQLNAPQQQAVMHDNGPILVIAGAGSGKTRVITARIAHLILEKGVAPSAIVALTFTNKAANEMKERIGKFLGSESAKDSPDRHSRDLPFVGTFHSYCVRLLKANQELLETPFFSILDDDDQKKLISGILTRNGLEKQISARNATYTISQIKNKLHNPDANVQDMFTLPFMYDVYQAYEKEKTASHVLDFDDLLLTALKLFKKNRTFKTQYQERIQHILVDEYQDTNVVQHALLKQMARRNDQLVIDSICAVGDEDQSIYSWRGATIANMLNFQKDFPGTQIIKIEQNYRSVQSILDVANTVIEHNSQRNPKKLWSEKKGIDRIRLLQCVSEYQEADLIASFASLQTKNKNDESIAVLYRTHTQSRAIEEALIKSSIPYKIIGGTQFYDRKEIKDVLAYLRLIVNPFDRMALFRVINTPARGLGLKFEEDLHTRWHQEPFLNHVEVAQRLIDEKIVTGKKQDAVRDYIRIFDDLAPDWRPADALKEIIKRTGYLNYLKTEYDKEEANTRIDNVKELIDAIQHFESQKIDTIEKFLDEVALMQEKMHAQDNESNKVLLMTLHAAKGLEFDNVILAGLEHGIIPSARSLDDDDALEEERRLFYVGITRAKERLLLSHVKFRYTYGKMVDQMPSQFLPEIPAQLISKFDCSYWNPVQQRAFFADWLNVKERSQVMTFGPAKTSRSIPAIENKNTIKQSGLPAPSKPIYTQRAKPSSPTQVLSQASKSVTSFSSSSGFKKNQLVHHEKYGPGLVQDVEEKGDGTKYVTVKFKSSTKKILSEFLK